MRLSVDSLFRILGALVGAVLSGYLGNILAEQFGLPTGTVTLAAGLLGAIIGFIVTPYLTTRPMRRLRTSLAIMPTERLVALLVGLLLGLVAAALFSLPLSLLPSPFREILPLLSALALCYIGVTMLLMRHKDLQNVVQNYRRNNEDGQSGAAHQYEDVILLDTSVVIDGRITDISRTGFIRSTLLVPGFILQNETQLPVRITDMDVAEVRDADGKLVALARHLHCPILTNDYNLNRVAELQGVTVLNINDLANAVKAMYLPGEELEVKIIQEGKEFGQGVGYLDDGTMVVVEDGRAYINRSQNVTVTKVLQTTAGRMIFARL
jgi:uncharacterized protein YacL